MLRVDATVAAMRRHLRTVRLALAIALPIVVASCGRTAHDQQAAASDSITLRVFHKGWGNDETADCNSDDWGWDSVTFRMAKEDTVAAGRGAFREVHLSLVRAFTTDSVLVAYRPRELSIISSTEKPWPIRLDTIPTLDSVVISSHALTFGTNTVDGGWYYRVRTVAAWPEPRRKRVRTTTLVGKVLDATSGRLIPYARVVVLGTTIGDHTDRTGRFTLTEVPVGLARLDACAGCYLKTHTEVSAPSESLVIRLSRRPGCSYPD